MIKYGLKIENELLDRKSIATNDYNIKDGEEAIYENYVDGVHHNRYILSTNAKLVIDCRVNPKVKSNDTIANIIDIYHEIIVSGDNCEVELKVKGLALADKIIYRCKIKANANIKGLVASQSIKFLKFNNTLSEIDAIPILELDSKDIYTSHSLAVSNIKPEDLYYLGLFGLNDTLAEKVLIEAFMK